MARQWYVIEDNQGGEFGMHRLLTAEEWLDQVIEWQESDGEFWASPNGDSEDYTADDFIAEWQPIIDSDPQEFIDFIADAWELEFAEQGVDGHDYYAEFTEYAAYFNEECIGVADTLDEAIALVQKEIDEMIASGDEDSVIFEECCVERFIEDDYDAYDADPIVYCADSDPKYKKYL